MWLRGLFVCYGKCKRACTIQSAWEWRFARAPSAREEASEWNEGADSRAGREKLHILSHFRETSQTNVYKCSIIIGEGFYFQKRRLQNVYEEIMQV